MFIQHTGFTDYKVNSLNLTDQSSNTENEDNYNLVFLGRAECILITTSLPSLSSLCILLNIPPYSSSNSCHLYTDKYSMFSAHNTTCMYVFRADHLPLGNQLMCLSLRSASPIPSFSQLLYFNLS